LRSFAALRRLRMTGRRFMSSLNLRCYRALDRLRELLEAGVDVGAEADADRAAVVFEE
jgi:hypothetical protein